MYSLVSHFELEAAKAIDDAVAAAEQNDASIDVSAARLIASCVHGGRNSALARFAGTGRLDRRQALLELEDVLVPEGRDLWVAALWDFIDQPSGRPGRSAASLSASRLRPTLQVLRRTWNRDGGKRTFSEGERQVL